MKKVDEYQLFTNIREINVNGIRMFCHALLLRLQSADDRGSGPSIRGFGTEAAWPVFDIFAESAKKTIAAMESPALFIGNDGKAMPLSSGYLMQFEGGPKLEILTALNGQPLQRDDFVGTYEDRVILRVWETLHLRVAQFWDAPNIPSLMWRHVGR